MDVHHIRYFLAVCSTLNFTRAAEECSVTQPALSRAIQQLEDEVGGQLFRRERSLTHLTDLGLVMKPRLQQIMDELSGVERDAKRFAKSGKPTLAIGVMCTIGPTRIAGFLAEFGRNHPVISLRVSETNLARLRIKLEERSIDLAIMASPQDLGPNFEQQPLYRERFVVGFPHGHRFMQMDAVPLEQLQGETYLNRINCEYDDTISAVCNAHGIKMHDAYASEREDWIQNLIAGGLGIALIPEFTAVTAGIQMRPVCDPEFWRDIKLVRLRNQQPQQSATEFTEAIRLHPWPHSRFTTLSTAA